MREIRDPVHGFIYRSSVEEEIIDTPLFQRLRKIKQLALASMVYPGALHTRFDHSLGVMHLAGRLSARLLRDDDIETKRIVRFAALLHDVGHGPFSHVSESIVDKFYDKKKVTLTADKEKIHEIITYELILHDDDLNKLLGERLQEQIVGVLKGEWGERILKDIISGPLDADKQDYLLRDSYFCGVKYGIYDIERLIDTIDAQRDMDERVLAISADGVHTLEQFVLAKYYMTTQVYRHKIRLITDAMIIRAIELGITKDKIDYLCKLYTYDGSTEFLKEWLKWNDEVLVTTICSDQTPEGYCKHIFQRLTERKLFKRIFTKRIGDFRNPVIRQRISEEFNKFSKDIENASGKHIGIDPFLVIANKFTIQSVREQSRNSEGSILVLQGNTPDLFEEQSLLFRSINEAEKDEFLEVYAPIVFKGDKDKKIRLREYSEQIEVLIENMIKDSGEEGNNESI